MEYLRLNILLDPILRDYFLECGSNQKNNQPVYNLTGRRGRPSCAKNLEWQFWEEVIYGNFRPIYRRNAKKLSIIKRIEAMIDYGRSLQALQSIWDDDLQKEIPIKLPFEPDKWDAETIYQRVAKYRREDAKIKRKVKSLKSNYL